MTEDSDLMLRPQLERGGASDGGPAHAGVDTGDAHLVHRKPKDRGLRLICVATFPRTAVSAVGMLLALTVSGQSPAPAAAKQRPTSADPPVSLARIRAAVEKPNGRSLKLDVPAQLPVARFKTAVERRRYMLSFEERLKKEFELTHLQRQSAEWGSRCCGLDLGALFKPIDRALQQRRQRKIREQIARELEALRTAADSKQ